MCKLSNCHLVNCHRPCFAGQNLQPASQLKMDAFQEICSHIGADPAKGDSLQQMYLNKSIPEELQLNLEENWQKLSASQASKKGFMVL